MKVKLDGQEVFDHPVAIHAGGVRREQIERSAFGLDGMLNIDCGGRGRKLRQNGTLRASSREGLRERIRLISAFIDGREHILVSESGQEFKNVRMDSFEVSNQRMSGSGPCCDYEVLYTQLRV